MGASTAITITGNKIAPGLGDWYLGRQGYGAEQHDGHDDPNRPNNLYEPVDEDRDFGAHGVFDDRSHAASLQLWADQHRDWIALAGAAGALGRASEWAEQVPRGGLLGRSSALSAWRRWRGPSLPSPLGGRAGWGAMGSGSPLTGRPFAPEHLRRGR